MPLLLQAAQQLVEAGAVEERADAERVVVLGGEAAEAGLDAEEAPEGVERVVEAGAAPEGAAETTAQAARCCQSPAVRAEGWGA